MTPERIQELKGRYEGLSLEDITFMTVGELTGLLAALEEAEHQKQTILAGHERDFNELHRIERELAEAQQTIARQREALETIANEDNWYNSYQWIEDDSLGTPITIANTALKEVQ